MATTPDPAGAREDATATTPATAPRTTPGSVRRSPALLPVAAGPTPRVSRPADPARPPVPSTAAELPLTNIWLG